MALAGVFAMMAMAQVPAAADRVLPNVINGQTVAITTAPWQVALLDTNVADDWNAQFCGGSIISATWIVTAAHCVEGETTASVAVRAGTNTLGQTAAASGPRLALAQIIVHPGWNSSSSSNDVALLRLASPVPLNGSTVAAISLPTGSNAAAWPAAGSKALLTGWGIWDNSDPLHPVTPNVLQGAVISVLTSPSAAACGDWGARYQSQLMLCAGVYPGGDQGACMGDSGGPLVAGIGDVPVLAGLTSWGRGDCAADPSWPGVYTRIATFVPWIMSQTGLSPGFAANPASVSLGPQWTDRNFPVQTLTITNPGTLVVSLTPIKPTGLNSTEFGVDASGCPAYLSPGASCAIRIGFSPLDRAFTGTIASVLQVGDQTVPLSAFTMAPRTHPTGIKARATRDRVYVRWHKDVLASKYTVWLKGRNLRGKIVKFRDTTTRSSGFFRVRLSRRYAAGFCVSSYFIDRWSKWGCVRVRM